MSEKLSICQSDFEQFEDVRKSGSHNMYSPSAREETTLTKSQWKEIISNYDTLKEKSSNKESVCSSTGCCND